MGRWFSPSISLGAIRILPGQPVGVEHNHPSAYPDIFFVKRCKRTVPERGHLTFQNFSQNRFQPAVAVCVKREIATAVLVQQHTPLRAVRQQQLSAMINDRQRYAFNAKCRQPLSQCLSPLIHYIPRIQKHLLFHAPPLFQRNTMD